MWISEPASGFWAEDGENKKREVATGSILVSHCSTWQSEYSPSVRGGLGMQPSASVCEARWPLASTHLSHADAYVLSLATLPTSYAASASSPSHKIDLFDKSSLRLIQSLPGHHVATTSVRAVDHILGAPTRTLISTGKDGSVKIWDERSGSHSIKCMFLSNMCALFF